MPTETELQSLEFRLKNRIQEMEDEGWEIQQQINKLETRRDQLNHDRIKLRVMLDKVQ